MLSGCFQLRFSLKTTPLGQVWTPGMPRTPSHGKNPSIFFVFVRSLLRKNMENTTFGMFWITLRPAGI